MWGILPLFTFRLDPYLPSIVPCRLWIREWNRTYPSNRPSRSIPRPNFFQERVHHGPGKQIRSIPNPIFIAPKTTSPRAKVVCIKPPSPHNTRFNPIRYCLHRYGQPQPRSSEPNNCFTTIRGLNTYRKTILNNMIIIICFFLCIQPSEIDF